MIQMECLSHTKFGGCFFLSAANIEWLPSGGSQILGEKNNNVQTEKERSICAERATEHTECAGRVRTSEKKQHRWVLTNEIIYLHTNMVWYAIIEWKISIPLEQLGVGKPQWEREIAFASNDWKVLHEKKKKRKTKRDQAKNKPKQIPTLALNKFMSRKVCKGWLELELSAQANVAFTANSSLKLMALSFFFNEFRFLLISLVGFLFLCRIPDSIKLLKRNSSCFIQSIFSSSMVIFMSFVLPFLFFVCWTNVSLSLFFHLLISWKSNIQWHKMIINQMKSQHNCF